MISGFYSLVLALCMGLDLKSDPNYKYYMLLHFRCSSKLASRERDAVRAQHQHDSGHV